MSFPSALTTTVQNPKLRLLNALRTNAKPIMTFLGLPSFRTAQMVAQTGLEVSRLSHFQPNSTFTVEGLNHNRGS